MGVLSFCRVKLRRGRPSKRSRSLKRKGVNDNDNGNKTGDIGGPSARLHEARFHLEVVREPPEAKVECVSPVLPGFHRSSSAV